MKMNIAPRVRIDIIKFAIFECSAIEIGMIIGIYIYIYKILFCFYIATEHEMKS